MIDGRSSDQSVEILEKYARVLQSGELLPRCKGVTFRWVSERDQGQVDAIEKDLAIAEEGNRFKTPCFHDS